MSIHMFSTCGVTYYVDICFLQNRVCSTLAQGIRRMVWNTQDISAENDRIPQFLLRVLRRDEMGSWHSGQVEEPVLPKKPMKQ
jgi:hypothetical protein